MRFSLGIISLFFSLAAEAQSTISLRAADLRPMVESRNERVQGKIKERDAASLREGSFARSFLPTAEVYGAQERFKKGPHSAKDQPTYGGEVRMNLFNGGRDLLDDERRTLTAEKKLHESSQAVAEELSKARETYWRIIYLRDYTGLLRDARKNSSTSLQAAERRIRSGVATETDRVEFEMQDIDLKRELEKAELEQANLVRTLGVALGTPPEAKLEFSEELTHEHDWENALKHTEEDHAFLVKPALLEAQEAETLSRSVRRAWLPKLDAFAAYNQFNQREEEEFPAAANRREKVVGLRVSMNLFEGFLNRQEAAALASEAAAAQSQANYAQREVEAHLHGEIAELKLLHAQVHEAEQNVGRADRYLRLTQTEYNRGVKNSPDLVGAMEKLVSLRQKRLEIVRDFQISKSHVLAKIGR